MANSKIYLGNTNIGSLFQGADDISIYLGENKVYPLEEPTFQGKWKATYSDSHTESAECDSSSEIVMDEINLTKLVSVEIGDCVTIIDVGAFDSCSSLTSVTIPDSVTSIGKDAFYECSSLTSIDIPDSITSIGTRAFRECSGLTSCTIGSGVTSIGEWAFDRCTSLTSVTVNAITPPTLGTRVFDDTNNCPIIVPCESVEAYKSAEEWSGYADRITCPPFEGKFRATYSGGETYELACDGNTTLTTGNTKPAGYKASAMTEAIIGDYCVTAIGNAAFFGDSGLTSVTIPDSVTSIGSSAFSYSVNIRNIDIPNSVTSIGNYAFQHCDRLTSVTMPSGIASLSERIFAQCYKLTGITIPDSVSSIGDYAFIDCSGLTSVTIPSGVTTIGSSAFANCRSLTSVTVNAVNPPTLVDTGVFISTNNCPIYVPSASVNAYKSATNWSSYKSRIQAIP